MPGTMDNTELMDQLPWVVNGSLPVDARNDAELSLPSSPELLAERDFLVHMREVVKADSIGGPGDLGWRRLRRQIEAESKENAGERHRRTWKGLAMAASLLLAVQVVWLHREDGEQSTYAPMGADSMAPATTGAVLQVRFKAEASIQTVQALLQKYKLQILSSPGAAGVWRLSLAKENAAAVEAALRTETSTVEFVAPEH
jgi:hypothetical protein